MRREAPPLAEDATFTFDEGSRAFSVNVPRLYCETIGAPVEEPVMQYCLAQDGWRREQLVHLAHRMDEILSPVADQGLKALPTLLKAIERRCRETADKMLEADDLTLWTPMDAERVAGGSS